jgi:hypothetical protein
MIVLGVTNSVTTIIIDGLDIYGRISSAKTRIPPHWLMYTGPFALELPVEMDGCRLPAEDDRIDVRVPY